MEQISTQKTINGEIARQYAAAHPSPNREKTPILIQRVKRASGYNYWISNTGEIKVREQQIFHNLAEELEINALRLEYGRTYAPNTKGGYYAAYANYVPELNMIELASIHMPGATAKKGETREWKYTPYLYDYSSKRIFLFKNDRYIYGEDGNCMWPEMEGQKYNKAFRYFCSEVSKMIVTKGTGKEFAKFSGAEYLKIGVYNLPITYPWGWNEWYKKNVPSKASKRQLILNELINHCPLTPIKELEGKYPVVTTNNQKTTDYFHFEKLNEDYCVIRFLSRPNYYNVNGGCFTEPYRIYIDKKGSVIIAKSINSQYRISSESVTNLSGSYNSRIKFGNPEETKVWNCLRWLNEILVQNEIKFKNPGALIVDLLRHPILEKIWKAGYHKLFAILVRDDKIKSNIQWFFNATETKNSELYKTLGCNKIELQWLEDHIPEGATRCTRIISTVKEIFGLQDISSFSKETVDIYFTSTEYLLDRCGHSWKYSTQLEIDSLWRYQATNPPITESDRERWKKILRNTRKDKTIIELLVDTIRLYHILIDKPDITGIFDINKAEDMEVYHNDIVNLQRAEQKLAKEKKDKLYEERFKKLQKERIKAFNYSNDSDAYLIKTPESLSDITTEGIKLSHCVGGYLSSHALGDSNILFLRKKESEEVPFYTIEVINNVVTQIHGYGNRWLGNSPEVVRFVIKWLKEKGIKCKNEILLNKSTQYLPIEDSLDPKDFGLA